MKKKIGNIGYWDWNLMAGRHTLLLLCQFLSLLVFFNNLPNQYTRFYTCKHQQILHRVTSTIYSTHKSSNPREKLPITRWTKHGLTVITLPASKSAHVSVTLQLLKCGDVHPLPGPNSSPGACAGGGGVHWVHVQPPPGKKVPLRNVQKRRESSAQICRQKRVYTFRSDTTKLKRKS